MSNRPISLLAGALLLCASLAAQNTRPPLGLRTGPYYLTEGLTQKYIDRFNTGAARFRERALALIQFDSLPAPARRQALLAAGVELLDVLPGGGYTATVRGPVSLEALRGAGVRALTELEGAKKLQPALAAGRLPAGAAANGGSPEVWVSVPRTFTTRDVLPRLQALGFEVTSTEYSSHRILQLRVPFSRLQELAAQPFIEYVQAAPPADQPLNFNARAASRANILNASGPGGYGLKGEGVVIGVGDNADVQTHADFSGRLINRAAAPPSGHGHHVAGIVGGGGNINELYTGIAPKATLIVQAFSGILTNAPAYVQDYGMVITNNSYGNIIECDYNGTYDLYSRILDGMAFDFPHLQHVFSAGNSGATACAPYATGFHTVLGSYQSAKNVLTVGATNDSGAVSGFSSRGPVRDGRIKPEVVAMGQFVASTWPGNIYSYNNGTSMSAPVVSGGLGLLYERYRQLHGGGNPKSGLMKAVLINGAVDRGPEGPDFSYGFGAMNLLRSVSMLDSSRHFEGKVVQGSVRTHTVEVRPGTVRMKVLLYWHDPAASPLSARALVHDLDLQLVRPDGSIVLPRVLDTARLTTPATTGVDRTNNLEQVILEAPAAGVYTLRVNGHAVGQAPDQEYFLVWDAIGTDLRLTAPATDDALVPGEQVKVTWDAYGQAAGSTVRLEWSPDNGITWNTVATGLHPERGTYSWWVPSQPTGFGRMRVVNEATGTAFTSGRFTIVGAANTFVGNPQCEGYFTLYWDPVPGATDYEVFRLRGKEMVPVGITANRNFTIGGLSPDSVYWMTVRARVDGQPGRRAGAKSRQPNAGTCEGPVSDGDLRLQGIAAPRSGRQASAGALTASTPVTIHVRNLDDAPSATSTLHFRVNNGPWISEPLAVSIPAGGLYSHTFSSTADLSALGRYRITAVVTSDGTDGVRSNDTATVWVKHLPNAPINLAQPFTDGFEGAAEAAYAQDTLGLDSLDRYDFVNSAATGRLRTAINTGMAYSGARAITLDADRFVSAGVVNFLIGTYHLGAYSTTEDLRLDFRFNQHGQPLHPANRLWVRGSESDPWVPLTRLDDLQGDPGQWVKTPSFEISRALAGAGQTYTSTFSVRWGQFGPLPATDLRSGSGYTFDELRLYQVFNDLQMTALDTPVQSSCGLGAAVPVRIRVRNAANTPFTNVPVRFRVDGGAWITETIPSIGAGAVATYTFSQGANLSALGAHTVETLVDFGADSFRENDTLLSRLFNSPVINQYPYLQTFEGGDGYWYARGKNSSWAYGTPAGSRISGAASGTRAWKTGLEGNYNDLEVSYLYSPCFDLTGLQNPTLSFSVAMDIEDCGTTLCDAAWVEYSADGLTWVRLGAAGSGTNWYNKAADKVWSQQTAHRWHVATQALPKGIPNLRFRFAFASDPGVTREGIAIDDVHVYDRRAGVYNGPTLAAPVSATAVASGWTDLLSGGGLVASVRPESAVSPAAQVYIHTGTVRSAASQYYLDRNFTVRGLGTDSVRLRLYFLEKEADSLFTAKGCTDCTLPLSPYRLGVSAYGDPDPQFENGSLNDNQQGRWAFLPPGPVSIVPYDAGYYAEFAVPAGAVEFWLSGGGADRSSPLPVKLMEFSARREGGNAALQWRVGAETGANTFEVEVARNAADLQGGRFSRILTVPGRGTSVTTQLYTAMDTEADKHGTRYYRLKVVHADGTFRYSEVRPVQFDEISAWRIYPNPSPDRFFLYFEAAAGTNVVARILDAKGALVQRQQVTASGFPQKLAADLSAAAAGVYLMEVVIEGSAPRRFTLYRK